MVNENPELNFLDCIKRVLEDVRNASIMGYLDEVEIRATVGEIQNCEEYINCKIAIIELRDETVAG